MSYTFKHPMFLKIAERFPQTVKRLHRDENGATAVEFAMIAFPFFLLIFAIIEASLLFFAGQYIETAVDDTMRLFRTGQLDSTTSEAEFRAALCERIVVMFDCDGIRTYVEVAQAFEDLNDPPEPDPTSGDRPANQFVPGCSRCIMQISASYEWPIFTNFAAPLAYNSGNYALLSVVAVSKTEPYSE